MTFEKEIDLSTRRLLFRKIQKGFDAKDYNIIASKLRIKIEHKSDALIPKKRRKISNSRFIGVRAI